MFKKLRTKFIVMSMVAITIVLFSIIAVINIKNYYVINKNADSILLFIINNEGKFPKDKNNFPNIISPETPFETRFFTVTLNSDGDIIFVDIDKIAAIDEDTAIKYTMDLYRNNKKSGFKNDYKYKLFQTSRGDMVYIFLDCSRSLTTFRDFLHASIIISLVGLLFVLLLVHIFSGIIMKPVDETYKKQKQFITNASHELKTPLSVIGASCEVLEYNCSENEWIQNIKDQVNKLTLLTDKLVFLSKIDEESKNYLMTDFSLTEVFDDAIKSYISVASVQNKVFKYNLDPNVSYYGDMSMIKELINILLDNAFKHSNSEGNIKVELTSVGKTRKITVSNTADDLPIGNIDMIFERFYRIDSSRNIQTGGHGIGLSIAKAIVELHKGKISAISPDGKTIIITVNL